MADSAIPGIALPRAAEVTQPRHPALVRITHWINTLSFLALLVSGAAILISHPRLYWGEVGNVGTPSLIDLPLPFVLKNQNGWGRYLHFLAAWVSVLGGFVYLLSGLFTRHFGKAMPGTYTLAQRRAYLAVVFVLFPLAIWTGLAMSPAVASAFPGIVTILGGQQSARTIHFFAALALTLFLLGHVFMVWRAGFVRHTRAMITGSFAGKERP
jgi:thiosulfate reductase cytochrome b subunit